MQIYVKFENIESEKFLVQGNKLRVWDWLAKFSKMIENTKFDKQFLVTVDYFSV